jgi:hypothetical protein
VLFRTPAEEVPGDPTAIATRIGRSLVNVEPPLLKPDAAR